MKFIDEKIKKENTPKFRHKTEHGAEENELIFIQTP